MRRSPHKDPLFERITFLKEVPLFADLQDEDLKILAPDLRLTNYRRGDIIFHQEDDSSEMYIVVEGKIRIFKTSPSGNEPSLIIFTSGDIIGEFALIDEQPRSATAKAIVRTTLLQVTAEKFAGHMRRMPDLAIAMNKLLVEKVRWTAAYAEAIAQFDAAGRLLHILLRFNERIGETLEPGKRYRLDLELNQTDLASLIGARREWINRLLQDWKKRGLIDHYGGQIIILDLSKVEAEYDARTDANWG